MATTTDEAIPRRLRVPLDVFRKVEAVRAHRSFNAFACRALELYAMQEAQVLAGGRPALTLVHPDHSAPSSAQSELAPSDSDPEHPIIAGELDPLASGDPLQATTAPSDQDQLDIDEPRRRQPPRPREEWGTR